MINALTAQDRTAAVPSQQAPTGPVTLMNSFTVEPDRDDAFLALWRQTSGYFTTRPGFIRLRLHRAAGPESSGRWVNVAHWESLADFSAAHATEEFRRLVTMDGWSEFPSSPRLYEVITAIG